MTENSEIASAIRTKALELGFSACGFAPSVRLTELEPAYREWLLSGKAAEMKYLARNVEVRLDPGRLVEGAKTVISLAAAYYFPMSPHTPGSPRISRYALGEDYHHVLKTRGKELLAWINREHGPATGRVFTDSAPVFEREWARRSGVGWIGKNGCLIIPRLGSWFFLAEIITDLEIYSEPAAIAGRCGSCRRCIDACPTGALAGDGSIDPRKCISYLTIENRGEIAEEFRGKWNDWIFGCDICQDVCPWNQKPPVSEIREFQPRPRLSLLDPGLFNSPDDQAFRELFDKSPVLRTGWSGILRNFKFLSEDE